MISEIGYIRIISEFGYDIRLVKSCVTASYGFLTQMAPHTISIIIIKYYSSVFLNTVVIADYSRKVKFSKHPSS